LPEIHTARLVLRSWTDDDRAPYARLNADPVVMQHYPTTLTRRQSDQHIDSILERIGRGELAQWAVGIREGAPFIGYVGLSVPAFDAPFTPCVEIGWRLARSHWGCGFATEPAFAALGHGFDDRGLDEIVSFTTPANVRSRRVMERIGMTRSPEDDFAHPSLPEGDALRPHVLYRLERSRWKSPAPFDAEPTER
jgi:RimJ/RimL family protein N-acetyltransferase